MSLVFVFLIMLLNFGISWFNAWGCGISWADSKAIGGFSRIVVWSAAVMSMCGFTSVYVVVLGLGCLGLGVFDQAQFGAAMDLSYLLIVPPIIGSGVVLTIHSYMVWYRERGILNLGVAGWNTFAQVHNTMSAIRTMPAVVGRLGDFFGSKGKKDKGLVVVAIVILALIGGYLTTMAIINSTARKYAAKVKAKHADLV